MQAQGGARCAQTQFDLGADRHPFDEFPELVGDESIAFVAAVESNFVAE